jgi:hypothetical protein
MKALDKWQGEPFPPSSLMRKPALRAAIRTGERHYVYILCRPDGRPFYVGKGVDYRVLQHDAEARNTKRLTHKLNLIRSLHRRGQSIAYVIDSFHEDETAALARERSLIRSIGRHDLGHGPLTSQTDGGEGTSNPSEESRERRRQTLWGDGGDDSDRALANRFFQQISSVESVPIKPLGKYRVEGLWRNRHSFGMSERQAAALVASAIVNRVMLEPGARLPRLMEVDGVPMIIENGVGRDTLSSEMTTLFEDALGKEVLQLTDRGYGYIVENMDDAMMLDAGIMVPSG